MSLHYRIMPWLAKTTQAFGTQNEDGQIISSGSTIGFVMAWLMGLVVVLPVTIWAADLFWRVFDEPCIAFARWLERIYIEHHEDDLQAQHRHLRAKTGFWRCVKGIEGRAKSDQWRMILGGDPG